MTTHAKALNQSLREAGVVWHTCDGCGRDWPFPKGFHENREWRCVVCASALDARDRRYYNSCAYYAAATDLCCDELERLSPEDLPDRRAKLVATLRNAAYWMRMNIDAA